MARTTTIELDDDVSAEQYTDLAHAAWMLLQVAKLADPGSVITDTDDRNDELGQRWRFYDANYPWQERT